MAACPSLSQHALRSGRHLGSAAGLGVSLGLTQLPSLPMGTRASELWAQEVSWGRIPGWPPLRFPLWLGFPLRRVRLRDCGKSSPRAERACARARVLCVRGGALRSAARPLLPPALHATAPVESPMRAPSRRGAHTRARAPCRRTQRPGAQALRISEGQPLAPAERTSVPFPADPVSGPLPLSGGPSCVPASVPCPARPRLHHAPARAQSGRRCSHPEAPAPSYQPAPPPAARCSPAPSLPLFGHCPFFTSSPFSYPSRPPTSRSRSGLSRYLPCHRPLQHPLLPAALLLSHSPHYIGCRPPLAGPRVRAHSGRRGDPRHQIQVARPPPLLLSTSSDPSTSGL